MITTPNTYVATVEAILWTGATVDFVDVERDTGLLSLNCLAKKIKNSVKKPKAIIPVHLFTQCVRQMNKLRSFAEKNNVVIVEDACQAIGATQMGLKAGSFGHAAAFSFYPSKNLGALGDGGAVLTNDSDLAAKIRAMRNHGQSSLSKHDCLGLNSGLIQFKRVFFPQN